MPHNPIVILLGATAVGKTDLSIDLAQAIGAEIISVDSRLLYRGMDIGTAKPSPTQLKEVKHHLIDVADPSERWSLTRYLNAVELAIQEISSKGKLPLLVGGTGQYLAAIVEGWQPPPKADDPQFRHQMKHFAETEGPEALHAKLYAADPASAERIDVRNIRRVIRALEIYHVTGEIPSKQRDKQPPPYTFLMMGLKRPRQELYNRIDQRIEMMLSSGWVEEVADLLNQYSDLDSAPLSAIGYRQIAEYLQGDCDLDHAVTEIKRLTRQFVRRQATWFRRFEPNVHWLQADEDTLDKMIDLVEGWLDG